MNSVRWILVFVVALLLSPAFGGAIDEQALLEKGVLVRGLPDGSLLCVINGNQESPSPRWFVLDGFQKNREIASATSAFCTVYGIQPSPDGRFLAVVSAAEGASILEIVDLPRLLNAGEWFVLREINPYPGQVEIKCWRGGHLEVTSNTPLFLLDRKLPYLMALLLPDDESFLVDPLAGTIEGVSLTPAKLVRNLKEGLHSPQAAERQDAARGIAALRQPDLIVHLRAALKAEKVKEVRQTIREALNALRSVESTSAGR